MKEYSREEVNTLWKQAYYRGGAASSQVSYIWAFLLLLLLPVAFSGLSPGKFVAWASFSLIIMALLYYGRAIWQKSEKGEYPARIAIIRNLMFSTNFFVILWLFPLLSSFSISALGSTNRNLSMAMIATIVVYVITIPIAFIWGKSQTELFFKEHREFMRESLNIFRGRIGIYFWVMALFLTITINLFLPVDASIRYVLLGSLLFPGAALMFFILPFSNIHLLLTLQQIGLENSPYQGTLKEVKRQLKEERKARRKGPTKIPGWCEGCEAQGEIEVDDSEGNYFVICEECGTETAQVWCDDSGAGGHFVRNIHEHPLEYDCEMCKGSHTLPADFCEKPVALKLIEEPRRKK